MAIDGGVLRFAHGTDLIITVKVIDELKDISPSGENWTFELTVRVNPSDADPAIYVDVAAPAFVVDGDASNDPQVRWLIADAETDAWATARQVATIDGLYVEHTHVVDIWRTNAGSETQLFYASILVDEAVRTVT